jgi:hypothetical protein
MESEINFPLVIWYNAPILAVLATTGRGVPMDLVGRGLVKIFCRIISMG